MKNNAIARIIIWSVVALILCASLIGGLVASKLADGGILGNIFSFGNFGYTYKNASEYSVGAASISAEGISSVEINWVSGSITLEAYDGSSVEISEQGDIDDDTALRYRVADGKLSIQCYRSGYSSVKPPEKSLNVKLPRETAEKLESVKIDSVSASVSISEVYANDSIAINNVSGAVTMLDIGAKMLDIGNVSGYISLKNANLQSIDFETVSGNLEFSGTVQCVNSDSVSGNVALTPSDGLTSVSMNSMSGNLIIYLPEDCGFTLDFDSMSGKFNSDYPTYSSGGISICGDGSIKINADSMSGDVIIKKP